MKNITLFLIIMLGFLFFSCGKEDTKPDPELESYTFTDTRDGQVYSWVLLKDGNKWMAENLNYAATDSWCYDDKESNCEKYGRLYDWATALTACPEGWRLPSDEEWRTMAQDYGGYGFGDEGKDAYTALIDGGSSGFDALLSGKRGSGQIVIFYGLDSYGYYWSSTEDQPDFAWRYIFNGPGSEFTRDKGGIKYSYYSCRCIQD